MSVWTQSNWTALLQNWVVISFKVVCEMGYCIWDAKCTINGQFIREWVTDSKCMVHNATCSESFHCHSVCWKYRSQVPLFRNKTRNVLSCSYMYVHSMHPCNYIIQCISCSRPEGKVRFNHFLHIDSYTVWITCTCMYCSFSLVALMKGGGHWCKTYGVGHSWTRGVWCYHISILSRCTTITYIHVWW